MKPSTAFNPQYTNIVEQLMKRQLVVQLPMGISRTIDLNKGESFWDLDIDDRQDVIALRLIVGRENVTITRKVDDEYVTGFFYHFMERDRPFSNIKLKSPIEKESIGFCYQNDGKAIEFQFNYGDILTQLAKRDKLTDNLKTQIDTTFDTDEMIEAEGKLTRLVNAPLNFNIERNQFDRNVIEMGINIPEFYKMTDEEKEAFQPPYNKYRQWLVKQSNKVKGRGKTRKGAKAPEPPRLPRLTEIGTPADVKFFVRQSGSVE